MHAGSGVRDNTLDRTSPDMPYVLRPIGKQVGKVNPGVAEQLRIRVGSGDEGEHAVLVALSVEATEHSRRIPIAEVARLFTSGFGGCTSFL